MLTRRHLLRTLAVAIAALPLRGWIVGRAAAAPAAGFHLVNGWILTTADLAAIAQHDR